MLSLDSVKKNYGSFVLDCSLEVRPGCVTGLIGQNGAGKSTTFKAILGLISIDGGTIELFGKNCRSLTAEDKEQLGVVLSDSGFSEYLTVKAAASIMENLYSRFDRTEFIERCREMGLPLDKKIKDFSTGMKAKLKVLSAVSHRARLLILDEPTAGLDVIARDRILDLLREYMEEDESRAILISSHISSDLEGLCDDLYMIHNGKIVMHEDTDVLLADYGLIKVNAEQYGNLEKKYLIKVKQEKFGYSCLTNHKQYYMENYPGLVVEKGGIDDVITMMIRGEER